MEARNGARKAIATRAAVLALVFSAGWVGGSLAQRPASAQVPGVGDAMKMAEGQGGALGAAAKLGTSITDMQEDVESLQKNLETLRTIQKALGG
jgi:hypothetical protein